MSKNRQRVYDEIITHLRKQGRKSTHVGMCAYRGDGGAKCAIGIFIPDEKYSPGIEGMSVSDRIVHEILPGYVRQCGKDFLTGMQRLHDIMGMEIFSKEFEVQTQYIAEANKLVYTPPETV